MVKRTIKEKNPHAVELGRLGGKAGGPARNKKLNKRQKSLIGRLGAIARWRKHNRLKFRSGRWLFKLNGSEREYIFKRDKGRCFYCGIKLKRSKEKVTKNTARFVVDHLWPFIKGGKTNFTNCVASCPPCNHKKKDKLIRVKDVDEFLAW